VKGALLALAFAPILFAGNLAPAAAQIPLPKLEARVTDLTGTLTAAQQSALEEKLAAFETRKGAQIAVLIVPTTAPEDIMQFGVRLLETWKLGRQGVDDGAALIVAKDDRAVRIEVQYGLEGVLTDATSNRIVNDTIVPLFKQGDFNGGINAGVDQMLRVVDGEPLPEPDRAWKDAPRNVPLPMILFVVLAVSGMLRRFFGRVGGASVAGVLGGAIGWWVTSQILFAVVGFFGMFLLALMVGMSGSGRGGSGRVFRDIGRGGGFGGGFGGGGGGGGWSGGGGRGGGGGASGRW
jgi:uncharacterized protein